MLLLSVTVTPLSSPQYCFHICAFCLPASRRPLKSHANWDCIHITVENDTPPTWRCCCLAEMPPLST